MSCAEFHEEPEAALPRHFTAFLAALPDHMKPRLIALGRGLRPFRRIIGVTRTLEALAR